MDFSSSGVVKTAEEIAHRWHQIKVVMHRDIRSLMRKTKG
jgi:hypothetical protein